MTYGADISYASLTTLSLDNILTGSTKHVEERYKETLEIEHRVRIQYFQDTLEGLENVTKTMEELLYVTGEYLQFTRKRLSLALFKLSKEISRDFNNSFNQIQEYVHEYEKEIGNVILNVEALKFYQSDIFYFIEFMRTTQVLDFAEDTPSRAKFEGQVLQLLLLADKLHTITNLSYRIISAAITNSKSSYTPNLPNIFWPDIYKDSNCNHTIKTLIFDLLPKLHTNTSQLFTVIQNDILQPDSFNLYVYTISIILQNISNNIPVTLKCLSLYRLTLMSTFNTIRSVAEQFELNTNILTFSIDNLVSSVTYDTRNIHRLISLVRYLKNKYSAYEITKLELAKGIQQQNIEKVNAIIYKIVQIVENQWLASMKLKMNDIKTNVPIWYHQILQALGTIAPYFPTSKAVDKIARNMSIWRQPKPELKSSSIMR